MSRRTFAVGQSQNSVFTQTPICRLHLNCGRGNWQISRSGGFIFFRVPLRMDPLQDISHWLETALAYLGGWGKYKNKTICSHTRLPDCQIELLDRPNHAAEFSWVTYDGKSVFQVSPNLPKLGNAQRNDSGVKLDKNSGYAAINKGLQSLQIRDEVHKEGCFKLDAGLS